MHNNKYRWSKGFIFFVIFLPAVFFMGFVVMFLWNHILPDAIHANAITYWQGLGLLFLSKILFGSFNKRHWGSERRMHAMKERFANMTPEEKEKFKAEWKDRCNRWRRKDDIPTSFAE
ncbi:MAG: hypothetical protein JWO92_1676 [Chitinophagaceae bacterium]|nr:hypothetical protein [Chitinophagaceae bacterium]